MSYRDHRDSDGRRERSRDRSRQQPPGRDGGHYDNRPNDGNGRGSGNTPAYGSHYDGPPRDNYRNDGPPRDNYRNDGPPRDIYGPPRDTYRNDGPPRDNYRNDRPPRDDFRNDRPNNGGRGGGGFRGGGDRNNGSNFRGPPPPARSKKPHMGEIESVQRLVRSNPTGFSDEACLKIIDPPMMEKFRDDLLESDNAQAVNKYWLPKLSPWRASLSIGVQLDNKTHIVRSNFFRMNPEKLPAVIYHYNVTIYRYGPEHQLLEDDLTKMNDKNENTGIIKFVTDSENHWHRDRDGNRVGVAYDGRSSLYATSKLSMNGQSESNVAHYQKDVAYPVGSKKVYCILVSECGTIAPPRSNAAWKQLRDNSGDLSDASQEARDLAPLQALDIALLSFARWQLDEVAPTWIIAGNKAFRSDGTTYQFSPAYLGRLGYAASLKVCLSGLLLVADVSVSCFLNGGRLVDMISAISSYRSADELYNHVTNDASGLPTILLQKALDVLKGCKLRMIHIGHTKKLKEFGFAACHRDSAFESDNGEFITVAEYFTRCATDRPEYKPFLTPQGLRYPRFPTVQVGSRKRSVLVPIELMDIIPGQSRKHNLPNDIASNIIKYAAMAPQDRFTNISVESNEHGLFEAMTVDVNTQAFGLNSFSTVPMKVQATILPPPKLQYGNRVIEPELRGSWNLAGSVTFAHPPPIAASTSNQSNSNRRVEYPYGILVTYRSRAPNNVLNLVQDFQQKIEQESRTTGIPLVPVDQVQMVPGHREALQEEMTRYVKRGARIVFVLLFEDVYPIVKFAGDSLCIPTQCIKWSNLTRPPKGYHTSVLVKVNMKMGGVNHTLASRMPKHAMQVDEETFQSPPKSISWLFDEPCMVMGIDVNHPEKQGGGGPSVAAVVASMDGKLGQYCCHVSTVTSHEEPVSSLATATDALLDAFSRRNNGQIPKRIIIYRDGLADNQFKEVLGKELTSIKDALSNRGISSDYTQVAVIMCQKRHSARFVYQNAGGELDRYNPSAPVEYTNPCVGLCVDGRSFQENGDPNTNNLSDSVGCINTPNMNEFYLNSHAAVLGTSKPCKYTLIYDEIGFKLVEIELLTFWLTHLYGRCTRSVSYATPAYYAHWAARRGKVLLNAGATCDELVNITEAWLKEAQSPSLYFV